MRYSLYIGAASNDKRAAYAWLLVNHVGVIASDVYLTEGERRFDESYCSHIALQRALRKVAQSEGIVQLRVCMDETVAEAVGYELLDVGQAPLYPTLFRTTKRILQRFDKYELASFKKDEKEQTPQEVAVFDDAIEALEWAETLKGRIELIKCKWLGSTKIIR